MHAGSIGFSVTALGLIALIIVRTVLAGSARQNPYPHGSARSVNLKYIQQSGLLPLREAGQIIALNAIATCFRGIDTRTGGLFRRNIFIVAGRLGMGKTPFAGAIAGHVAHNGISVAFTSAESLTDAIFKCMLSRETGIENRRSHQSVLKNPDFTTLALGIGRFDDRKFYFLDVERRWLSIRGKIEKFKTGAFQSWIGQHRLCAIG
jgi:replicative DNA helicase